MSDLMIPRRRFLTGSAAVVATPTLGLASTKAVRIRDLYDVDGSFSNVVTDNLDTRLKVQGFMAPPLKADSHFFVLTKLPLSVCPFCESSAEWPNDIVAIYTKRPVEVIPFNVKIEVDGVVDTGAFTDPDTGFVSLLRLNDAIYS